MAGAGVPVPMDDGTAIAAAPEIVCPLPGVARSGQQGRGFFAGDPPRPMICPTWWGVGNAVTNLEQQEYIILCGIWVGKDLWRFLACLAILNDKVTHIRRWHAGDTCDIHPFPPPRVIQCLLSPLSRKRSSGDGGGSAGGCGCGCSGCAAAPLCSC